jgi:hypothetical protein
MKGRVAREGGDTGGGPRLSADELQSGIKLSADRVESGLRLLADNLGLHAQAATDPLRPRVPYADERPLGASGSDRASAPLVYRVPLEAWQPVVATAAAEAPSETKG